MTEIAAAMIEIGIAVDIVDLAPTRMGEVMVVVRTHTALCPVAGAILEPAIIRNRPGALAFLV